MFQYCSIKKRAKNTAIQLRNNLSILPKGKKCEDDDNESENLSNREEKKKFIEWK